MNNSKRIITNKKYRKIDRIFITYLFFPTLILMGNTYTSLPFTVYNQFAWLYFINHFSFLLFIKNYPDICLGFIRQNER
jgi:hypothetical protein